MDVKEKINTLRKERGWTLCKLAKEIGISQTAVYNWYNEKNSSPSRETVEDICAVFQISIAEFYADIDSDNLTEKEVRLLELFRKIPTKNQEKAISMLEMLMD